MVISGIDTKLILKGQRVAVEKVVDKLGIYAALPEKRLLGSCIPAEKNQHSNRALQGSKVSISERKQTTCKSAVRLAIEEDTKRIIKYIWNITNCQSGSFYYLYHADKIRNDKQCTAFKVSRTTAQTGHS